MAAQTALAPTDVLTVRYANRRTLLELVDSAEATLFVLCTKPVRAGHNVALKVTFADSNRNFYIRGSVRSVRERAGQRVGFSLLIRGPAEARAFSHLLAFCSRNQEAAKRFETEIPCELADGSGVARGKIRDLSMTGAFVATGSIPLDGSKLVLSVKGGFLGLSRSTLEARVVWTGEKKGHRGFGAEFLSDPRDVMTLLRRYVVAQ